MHQNEYLWNKGLREKLVNASPRYQVLIILGKGFEYFNANKPGMGNPGRSIALG